MFTKIYKCITIIAFPPPFWCTKKINVLSKFLWHNIYCYLFLRDAWLVCWTKILLFFEQKSLLFVWRGNLLTGGNRWWVMIWFLLKYDYIDLRPYNDWFKKLLVFTRVYCMRESFSSFRWVILNILKSISYNNARIKLPSFLATTFYVKNIFSYKHNVVLTWIHADKLFQDYLKLIVSWAWCTSKFF